MNPAKILFPKPEALDTQSHPLWQSLPQTELLQWANYWYMTAVLGTNLHGNHFHWDPSISGHSVLGKQMAAKYAGKWRCFWIVSLWGGDVLCWLISWNLGNDPNKVLLCEWFPICLDKSHKFCIHNRNSILLTWHIHIKWSFQHYSRVGNELQHTVL